PAASPTGAGITQALTAPPVVVAPGPVAFTMQSVPPSLALAPGVLISPAAVPGAHATGEGAAPTPLVPAAINASANANAASAVIIRIPAG
ncbi:hypothetical protein LXA32_17575, partial [Erwinia amylovora]|nr:hypothetical protein [Erwinia amylovora]